MARSRKIVINRLPLTKARINLGDVIRKAHINKQYFILEKDGIPVVGIMDIDEFEDYLETRTDQEDPEFQTQIKEGFEAYKEGKVRTTDEFFDASGSRKSKK